MIESPGSVIHDYSRSSGVREEQEAKEQQQQRQRGREVSGETDSLFVADGWIAYRQTGKQKAERSRNILLSRRKQATMTPEPRDSAAAFEGETKRRTDLASAAQWHQREKRGAIVCVCVCKHRWRGNQSSLT